MPEALAVEVQGLSSVAHSHLDMGGLDAFDDPATCEKLLESLRPLLGGGNNDIFPALQLMMNAGNAYLAPISSAIDPSSTTISTDDIEILDNPAMLNPLDHDMLLSSIGTNSSSMGISCEELSPPLDHAEKWAFSDGNYPMWKLQEFAALEQSNLLSHGLGSSLEGNQTVSSDAENARLKWSPDSGKQPDTRLDTGLSILIPEGKGMSALDSPVKYGLSRHNSANDLFKLSDTSDNSDGMDDMDEGLKHSPNGKSPMSKNLVSERRRRKKLNERLYSLRAIVPKISKMDKASIVGDAINYVRDLQKQVEDMQADIVNLQSHTADGVVERDEDVKPPVGLNPSVAQEIQEHKILELEVSKMEEQTYHLRIHCKKGPGVLVQLTRALEALDFEIVNANLTSVSDHILNTIVVKVKNGEIMRTEELREMTLEVVPKFGLHL